MIGVIVSACAQDTSAPVFDETQALVTETPTQVSPALEQSAAATLEPFVDFACLDCHTDQVQLTALALPKEAEEKLSTGPG